MEGPEQVPEQVEAALEEGQQVEQADPLADPRVQEEINRRVQEMAQRPVEEPPARGDFTQAIAQLQQSGEIGQFLLEVANLAARAEARAAKAEDLSRTQRVIPPEKLADAETEFSSGNYKDLLSAHYAAEGKKLVQGKTRPAPPPMKRVQTAIPSAPQLPSVTDLTEITASQWREVLKGPQSAEYRRAYKSGKLTVVPG